MNDNTVFATGLSCAKSLVKWLIIGGLAVSIVAVVWFALKTVLPFIVVTISPYLVDIARLALYDRGIPLFIGSGLFFLVLLWMLCVASKLENQKNPAAGRFYTILSDGSLLLEMVLIFSWANQHSSWMFSIMHFESVSLGTLLALSWLASHSEASKERSDGIGSNVEEV